MEPGGASSSEKTLTNWLDLPRDLTIQIFIKVGVVDLLCSAQSVCSSWQAIARDPRLYRVIDMSDPSRFCSKPYNLVVNLATEAIDRSCGQATEFSIGGPDCELKDDILYQLMYKTPGLKCLRLSSSSCVHHSCMIEVIPKLPLLEEVEFCNCYFSNSKEVIQVLGRSCPKLKSFQLNNEYELPPPWKCWNEEELFNEDAFAIAGNMNPNLLSLDLYGNLMTNSGLEAILDRFSQLEYLDIRECFKIHLNEDLLKRCRAIKRFRLPNDSTDDYEYNFPEVLFTDYEDDDSDYEDVDSVYDYFGW